MSAIVNAIDDLVAGVPLVREVWDGVKDVVDAAWKEVVTPVLEFIFGLLDITDEEITTVQMTSQRVMKDDSLGNIQMLAALWHQSKDVPILSTLAQASAEIRTKYSSYDRAGEDFIDGHPTASIHIRTIDEEKVKTVLDNLNGQSTTVLEATTAVPTKDEWCRYNLQSSNNYKPYNGELIYGGEVYRYAGAMYNYITDEYEVDIDRYEDVVTNTYDKVVTTVVNIDATTDKVTVTTYVTTEIVKSISGTTSSDELINTSMYNVVKGSVLPSTVSVLIGTVSSEEIYSSTVLYVDAHSAVQMYVVKYEWVVGEWYYWIYNPDTNVYPELDTASMRASGLEMLPVVALRLDKVSIDSDKESVRYKSSKDILKTIGVDIDTMLEGLNASPSIDNVANAFVSFGIGINDQSPIVSKALYIMADTIYQDDSIREIIEVAGAASQSVYSFSVNEGPYNQVAKWASQSRTVKSGVIGPVGVYKHQLVEITVDDGGETSSPRAGATIIMQKQELEESYVEYEFTDITSMTWISHGGYGDMHTISPVGVNDNGQPNADNFAIPLSMFFVGKLNGNEQRELFVKTLRVSFYAIEITHLEWYETSNFAGLMQFIAMVIFILSIETLSWVSAAIIIATTYALKKVLESNAPDWLKAVTAVAYVYVNVMYGGGDPSQGIYMTGVQVVSLTTNAFMMDLQVKMARLQDKSNVFAKQVEERQKENEEKAKGLVESGLDSGMVTKMVSAVTISPSTQYDIAKGKMLYDQGILYDGASRSKDFYKNAFDVSSK